MINFLMIGLLLLIVGVAITYIVKAKKSGIKCIGCPLGGSCSDKNGSHTGCNCSCCNLEK